MIQGVTRSGFPFTVRESLANDFRFVLLYDDMHSGEPNRQMHGVTELLRLTLGAQGLEALMAHVRQEDGSVPTDRILEEMGEIFAAAGRASGAVKN